MIAFEGENFWVSEMHPCTDKGFVLDRIATHRGRRRHRHGPGDGGGLRGPASTTVAKLKHVIILTDGISAPGDFEGIAQAMAADRITVLDRGHRRATPTRSCSRRSPGIGNGRYYVADDPAPGAADLRQGDGDGQQVGHQRAAVHAAGRPADARCSPRSTSTRPRSCWATSMTRPKPTSEVILATEKGDPLLAWWRYGLGMTRGVHLRRQGPLGRRVADLAAVRQVLGPGRPPRDAQGRGQGDRRAGRPQGPQGDRSSLDAIEPSGRFLNRADDRADADRPAARHEEAGDGADRPRAATRPSSTPTQPGSYQLDVHPDPGRPGHGQQSRGLAVGYPDELRLRPTNTELLRVDRRGTGGRFDPKPESVFDAARADRAAGHAALALPGRGGRAALRARRGPAADRPDPAAVPPAADSRFPRGRLDRTIVDRRSGRSSTSRVSVLSVP